MSRKPSVCLLESAEWSDSSESSRILVITYSHVDDGYH